MGGNLAWTLRLSDCTEYRMDRWTNVMPNFINSVGFLNEDEEHIRKCLESWLEMKDDWERNKATGRFEQNMTGVYAPYPFGCQPSEYGIVVTDFVTKTIITSQDYFGVGQSHIDWFRDGRSFSGEDNKERLFGLLRAGRIKSIMAHLDQREAEVAEDYGAVLTEVPDRGFRDRKFYKVEFPIGNVSYDEVREFAALKSGFEMYHAEIDMSPFTVEEYREQTPDAWRTILRRVKELGFEISEEEEKGWQEAIDLAQDRLDDLRTLEEEDGDAPEGFDGEELLAAIDAIDADSN